MMIMVDPGRIKCHIYVMALKGRAFSDIAKVEDPMFNNV